MMTASLRNPTDPRFLAQVKLACVPGIGSRMRQLLVDRFGSPEAVFTAPAAEVAAIPRFGRRMAAAIAAAAEDATAAETISLCRSRDVDIVPKDDDGYPGLLARIADPPDLLFVRGRLKSCDSQIGRAHV